MHNPKTDLDSICPQAPRQEAHVARDDGMEIDITDLVRDYLIRYTYWLNEDRERQDQYDAEVLVYEFLKEDR